MNYSNHMQLGVWLMCDSTTVQQCTCQSESFSQCETQGNYKVRGPKGSSLHSIHLTYIFRCLAQQKHYWLKGVHCICIVYTWIQKFLPLSPKPSCLHATLASSGPQSLLLLHTVPHRPPMHTCSRPSLSLTRSTRRTALSVHSGSLAREEEGRKMQWWRNISCTI